jgi:hypothetical protein
MYRFYKNLGKFKKVVPEVLAGKELGRDKDTFSTIQI